MDATRTSQLGDADVIQRARDATAAELAGETVILHPSSGKYFGLKAVGSRVWELLDRPRTFSDLRDAIVREYDVDPARCSRDLAGLIDQLRDAGLVVVGHAPSR